MLGKRESAKLKDEKEGSQDKSMEDGGMILRLDMHVRVMLVIRWFFAAHVVDVDGR